MQPTPALRQRSFPTSRSKNREELRAALTAQGLEMPLLVAPSTPRERAKRIAEATAASSTSSRASASPARAARRISTPLHAQMAMLREVTEKPLAVGFGVSRPEHVREVAALADGFIVGSALIDAYAGKAGASAASALRDFAAPLVQASRTSTSSY